MNRVMRLFSKGALGEMDVSWIRGIERPQKE